MPFLAEEDTRSSGLHQEGHLQFSEIYYSCEKAKEKKYTQQITQHSEKKMDWQLHTYPCNGYNPSILNFHQLYTIKSKFESTMMKIARYLENVDGLVWNCQKSC